MKKVVTLGEIMLRLSPEGRKRFLQADRLDVNYGGSEANVAVALCNMAAPPNSSPPFPKTTSEERPRILSVPSECPPPTV